ncbi:Phorbol-ester/DAG-type domain-containing protein [Psidium guajava]|nr:Phorbol-ester/DAG-type domain-containing protein [Psidium guajava]
MANISGHWIHPEHELKPMKPRDPFYCAACKEIGFGPGYGCPQCVVRIHKECARPSPNMSRTIQMKHHSLKFYPDMKGENGKAGICSACSRPVQGCGYSSTWGDDFHPACLALPESIMVNGTEARLSHEMKSNCRRCHMMEFYVVKDKLPSWSYGGWKGRYHVGCVKDMVIESFRNGEFVPAKEGDGAGVMQIKVDLSRGISGFFGIGGELVLRGAMAAMIGDPACLAG